MPCMQFGDFISFFRNGKLAKGGNKTNQEKNMRKIKLYQP